MEKCRYNFVQNIPESVRSTVQNFWLLLSKELESPTCRDSFVVLDVSSTFEAPVDVDIFWTVTSLPEIYFVFSSSLDLASFIVKEVSTVEASVNVDIGVDVNIDVNIDADIVDNAEVKAAVFNLCIDLHSFI